MIVNLTTKKIEEFFRKNLYRFMRSPASDDFQRGYLACLLDIVKEANGAQLLGSDPRLANLSKQVKA